MRSYAGFSIGAGFIALGLLLQWLVGPVDWSVFCWPVNGIVLAAFLILIVMLYLCCRHLSAVRYLLTTQSAFAILVYAVLLTLVMGLTRQSEEGLHIHQMVSFWPFVLIYLMLSLILGLVIMRRLTHFRHWRRDLPFLLNHLGLFVALTTATLGSGDRLRLKMIAVQGQLEWRAMTPQRQIVGLPFAIGLDRFIMESYADGSPKRFASEIQIITKRGQQFQTTVDVNHPAELGGWKIYQYGYDTQRGAESQYCIFELVRDPWLPCVYAGIFMMLGGAVFMFFSGSVRPPSVRSSVS